MLGAAGSTPNPGCDQNGTFAGLDFINSAFVASQYQPTGGIPFKQAACNDPANTFSTVTRAAGATGNCFAGQVDVGAARTMALGWVAVAWLHYDASDNKGYPDPYPIDPAKNAGTDAICLTKKDTWTEVTLTLGGWAQLPIMRGFYFKIGIIDQTILDSVNEPVQFFVDSGKYL